MLCKTKVVFGIWLTWLSQADWIFTRRAQFLSSFQKLILKKVKEHSSSTSLKFCFVLDECGVTVENVSKAFSKQTNVIHRKRAQCPDVKWKQKLMSTNWRESCWYYRLCQPQPIWRTVFTSAYGAAKKRKGKKDYSTYKYSSTEKVRVLIPVSKKRSYDGRTENFILHTI